MTIPAYARAIWKDGKVTNKGALPLWSGEGEPPAIGSTVMTRGIGSQRVTITGYEVLGGWLHAYGVRADGKTGNLAGAEILWPDEN